MEPEPQPPAPRRMLYSALTAVVFTTMFERLSYYAITGNFLMYVTIRPFLWSNENATLLNLLSLALSYFSAVIFGIVSDVWVPKFYVIAISLIVFSSMSLLYPILYPFYGHDYILPTNLTCVDNGQNASYLEVLSNFSKYICKLGNDASDTNRPLFSENCSYPIIFDDVLMMSCAGAIEATLVVRDVQATTHTCSGDVAMVITGIVDRR